jgi:hypothetical protein
MEILIGQQISRLGFESGNALNAKQESRILWVHLLLLKQVGWWCG